MLGALIPWLLTHDDNPRAQPKAPFSSTDPGGSNGSGEQDASDSSSGQDGGGPSVTPASNKTRKGSWPGKRGDLTVTVTQVDNEAGHIRLHIRVDNGYSEAVQLTSAGYFVANDDAGNSYDGDYFHSKWSGQVPAGGHMGGVIELKGFVEPEARSLSISFTQIFGSLDAPDSITVYNIPIPR
ncbi:hypothetical protein [Streptomyces sp. NPDC004675]|uniref:hypothetical protein n=1 Tax=Streptomyces sp. NPDC004675 TaxID=3154286 RepID=UPI0033B0FB99